LDCGGKRSATPLSSLSFPGLRESTGAQCAEGHTAVEKAPSQLRFAVAVENAPAFEVRQPSAALE